MISWNAFERLHDNHTSSFENMCRLLFKNRLCAPSVILHSEPNNPGVEVVPVLGKTNHMISFQAKYFSGNVNYSDIQDSCRKTVKHYIGQLETVYLYYNKDITTSSTGYKRCAQILSDAGISLIPVSNQEILDQALEDALVRDSYLGCYTLPFDWFERQTNSSISSLGKRYNDNFNIQTEAGQDTDLFCHSDDALNSLLDHISEASQQIDKYYGCLKSSLLRPLQKELIILLTTPLIA